MKKIIFATKNEGKMREIRMILADLGVPVLSLKEAGMEASIEENGSSFEENAVIKARAIADLMKAQGSGNPGADGPVYAEVQTDADGPAQAEVQADADGPAQTEVQTDADGPTQTEVQAGADGPAQAEVQADADGPAQAEVQADADGPVQAAVPTGVVVLADDSGLEIDYLNKEPGIYSARYMGEDTSYEIKNQNLIDRLAGVPEEARTARFVCVIAAVADGKVLTARGTMEGRIAHAPSGGNGFGYDPIFYLPEFGCTSAELPPEQKNEISHRGKALRAIREQLKNLL